MLLTIEDSSDRNCAFEMVSKEGFEPEKVGLTDNGFWIKVAGDKHKVSMLMLLLRQANIHGNVEVLDGDTIISRVA